MDNTGYLAIRRQIGLREKMAISANNMANATTAGFKRENLVFAQHVAQTSRTERLVFGQDLATIRDIRQGPIEKTGNPLDIAIDGPGMLQVQGQGGRTLYTHDGHLAINTEGQLTTSQGHPVLDTTGQAIALPPQATGLEISPDGWVSTEEGMIAQIGIVGFASSQDVAKVEGNLYEARPGRTPVPVETPRVLQGMIEGSNVQPITEMVGMMDLMRSYENTHNVIENTHELQRRYIERLGRV